jgi:predicted dehydrogenase
VRILVAGLGAIGQRHARNLRILLGDRLELLALRSRRLRHVVTESLTADASQDVEAVLGARVFTDPDAALAERPDAVFICTPSSLHLDLARRAAERGCHLFIEKPLAASEEGVEALLDLVERRGVVATVGCQWRWHPVVHYLHDRAAGDGLRGLVGEPLSVHAEYGEWLPGWHPYEDHRRSYAARRDLGGGVILTQIHDFDYLCWTFGLPARVMASGGRLGTEDIDVEDTAVTLLECRWQHRVLPVLLHQDMLRRSPVRTCRIIGTDGDVTADLLGGVVRHRAGSGAAAEVLDARGYSRNQMFVEEVTDFLRAVETRTAPRVTLREAADCLRVALAARRSLESGEPCPMQWPDRAERAAP